MNVSHGMKGFARALARAPWAWRASMGIGGIVALLVVGAALLAASGLSRDQLEEREFGTYSRRIQASSFVTFDLADPAALGRFQAAVRDIDPQGSAQVTVESPDIRVSSQDLATGTYRELDPAAFPSQYALLAGRWPSVPGEAVATPALVGGRSGIGSDLQMLDGSEQLRVVGIARALWSTDGRFAVAAQGTWASWRPDPAQRLGPVGAIVFVLWNDTDLDGEIARALTAAGIDAGVESAPTEAVEERNTFAATTVDWSRRLPMAVTVPSWLLSTLGGASVTVFNLKRLRRTRRVFDDNGVDGLETTTVFGLAIFWVCTRGLALGLIAGTALAAVSRQLLPSIATRPIGPWPKPLSVVVPLTGGLLVGALVGVALTLTPSLEGGRAVAAARAPFRWRALVAAVFIAGSLGYARPDSLAPSHFLVSVGIAAGVSCLLPEAIGALAQRGRERSLTDALVRRRAMSDPHPLALQTSAVVMTLVSAFVVAIIVASSSASAMAAGTARVSPGQLAISRPDGMQLDPALLDLASEPVSTSRPVVAHMLTDEASGEFASAPTRDGGIIHAFANADEMQQVIGELDGDELELIENGGVLVFQPEIESPLPVTYRGRTVEFPAAAKTVRSEWQARVPGVMLLAPAKAAGLPTSPTVVVFTGASESTAQSLLERLADAGYGSRFLERYQPPAPVIPALGYWAATVATLLAALGMNLLVATNSLLSLKRRLDALHAIGVPRAWPRRVVIAETALPLVIGLPIAVVLSVVPTYLMARGSGTVVFSVPVWSLVGSTMMVAVGCSVVATIVYRKVGRLS